MPDATRETRMLSMLVCVSAVFVNAPAKSPPFTLSNSPAGIVVRLEHLYQAVRKLVPDDVSMSGKLVRLTQLCQAYMKLVPEDVSMSGKLVRLTQLRQAYLKSVPEDVSMSGKLVRLEQ